MIFKAVGLMSGTSMDGIDVALIETDGQDYIKPLAQFEADYPDALKQELRMALLQAQSFEDRAACFEHFSCLEQGVTLAQISALKTFLSSETINTSEIDLIGFHGQTILHRPDLGFTVQLGDGQKMANELQIPVVYDFRSQDMKMGGEGAPLAPIYHQALGAKIGKYPLCFVNIGGVSNVTYIESEGAEPIAFDCGPGNALIDDWVFQQSAKPYDEGGKIAAKGKVDENILAQLLKDDFFSRPAPKSLDRNHFATENLALEMQSLNLEDGAAILTEFTAQAIMRSTAFLPQNPQYWLICGGGRKNTGLMSRLQKNAGSGSVVPVDDFELDGDFMEAEAFGYLAVRSKLGLPISFPKTTGCFGATCGGVLAEI